MDLLLAGSVAAPTLTQRASSCKPRREHLVWLVIDGVMDPSRFCEGYGEHGHSHAA
jgi:hypothetical protein